jgi:hypothetical protein
MKQVGLSEFKRENYTKTLPQVNLHKYRNICPDCGHKGRKTGEGHHDNPWTGESYYFETFDCVNDDCDASSYFA